VRPHFDPRGVRDFVARFDPFGGELLAAGGELRFAMVDAGYRS